MTCGQPTLFGVRPKLCGRICHRGPLLESNKLRLEPETQPRHQNPKGDTLRIV